MLWLVAVILLVGVVAMLRGVDIRWILLVCAAVLAAATRHLEIVLREFWSAFGNEKFLIPLSTAMGFAFVMRHTGCDVALVQLLVRPLRRVKPLVPAGIVAVGFLVNIPIVSQASTSVCVGTVVIPLAFSAGLSPIRTAAALLLGCSMGGELLNPSAVELNTVGNALGTPSAAAQPFIRRLLLPHFALSLILFAVFDRYLARRETPADLPPAPPEAAPEPAWKGLIPLAPVVALILTSPPFGVVEVPEEWLTEPGKEQFFSVRLIGSMMLLGSIVAAALVPRKAGGVMKAFFEGAGLALATSVSLIVVANLFGSVMKISGAAAELGEHVGSSRATLEASATLMPFGFAFLSGSGLASTQSLFDLFVVPARQIGVDPVELGASVAISSAVGRTCSPVAAVVLLVAAMTGVNPFRILKRVAPVLIISWTLVRLTA